MTTTRSSRMGRLHFTMPAGGHPLVVKQTARVRDAERYGMWNVTFAVTYFGEDRAPVTVGVSENRSQDGGHADALRAAEALVFASEPTRNGA